jgi:hypothetical protein
MLLSSDPYTFLRKALPIWSYVISFRLFNPWILFLLQDEGWKLNRNHYYQEGWLATGNIRGILGVTYTTSHWKKNYSDVPIRTNYNLRGHRAQVIGSSLITSSHAHNLIMNQNVKATTRYIPSHTEIIRSYYLERLRLLLRTCRSNQHACNLTLRVPLDTL